MVERSKDWDWPHIFPRKLILTAWLAFHLIAAVGFLVQWSQSPQDPYWLTLWKSIGGNSSAVWYWFVSWVYLNSEVITMILTLMSNKARIEKAVAEAVAEATAAAREEATAKAMAEQYRIWSEWNSRREAAAALGQDFHEPPPAPPPGFVSNGNYNNGGQNS